MNINPIEYYSDRINRCKMSMNNIQAIKRLVETVSYESLQPWLESELHPSIYHENKSIFLDNLDRQYANLSKELEKSYEWFFKNIRRRLAYVLTRDIKVKEKITKVIALSNSISQKGWTNFSKKKATYSIIPAETFRTSVVAADDLVKFFKMYHDLINDSIRFVLFRNRSRTGINMEYSRMLKNLKNLLSKYNGTISRLYDGVKKYKNYNCTYSSSGYTKETVKKALTSYAKNIAGNYKFIKKLNKSIVKWCGTSSTLGKSISETTSLTIDISDANTSTESIGSLIEILFNVVYLLTEYYVKTDYMIYRIARDLYDVRNK